MDRSRAAALIGQFDFATLFAEELLWNRLAGTLLVEVEGVAYPLRAVAEKKQVQVLLCPPLADGALPPYALRQKIERQVVKQAREHLLVYTDAAHSVQVWQWVAREPGRPAAYREIVWRHGQAPDLLLEKLGAIAFRLDDDDTLLTVLDVAIKLRDAFDRDKLTKRFYEDFRVEREAFLKFIGGMPGDAAAWYASVTINRLMFVYFLQRKRLADNAGFLDNRHDYLRHHLQKAQRRLGADRYYSDFLCPLFFQGFAQAQRREEEVHPRFGDIPYLNGGLFNRHPLEDEYGARIRIADAAFERLFDYFDAWDWHLDDRPLQRSEAALASARLRGEINPEVLGYIFEKYINQKQLGAYYTKEDITGYICRNTVLPGVLAKLRARCEKAFDATAWPLLQQDPDRYIWPALRHGTDLPLPEDIAAGLDPAQPDLLERRRAWNRRAPESHALPTEIWREVVARREHCAQLRAKLAAGAVRSVDELIALNLDIEQFAQDLVAHSEDPALVRALWRVLAGAVPVPGTAQQGFEYGFAVLDPTCGSGAFLFAALNVLEPLYRACLTRMRAHVLQADLDGDRRAHELFRAVLADVDQRPNESYFICKTIVVNNLYGVDIVEEAVEIAKLRLFLKLVAQLDDKRIEPLPDIDFNIRTGNALVGFATYDEVKHAVTGRHGQAKLLFDDAMTLIEQDADEAERAYQRFRQQQAALGGEVTAEDKADLRRRLGDLEARLNWYLAREYGLDPQRTAQLAKWQASHKPFHWFVDFYGIVHRAGGFDAVVGNPPFLEERDINYAVRELYTQGSGAIHAWCAERSLAPLSDEGGVGMVMPMSFASTQRMLPLLRLYMERGLLQVGNFAWRPGKLFDEVNRAINIFVSVPGPRRVLASPYTKWYSEGRDQLMARVSFTPSALVDHWIAKVGTSLELNLLRKLLRMPARMSHYIRSVGTPVFYRTTGGLYWKVFTLKQPAFTLNGKVGASSRETRFLVDDEPSARAAAAALSSSLFWWWYTISSTLRDLNPADVAGFPMPVEALSDSSLQLLGRDYQAALQKHSEVKQRSQRQTGITQSQTFHVNRCKREIDAIDARLAVLYSLTVEELDFVTNYDIKYRLGAAADDDG